MLKTIVLSALLVATLPVAAADADLGGVCPPHNPTALTNACVETGYGTQTVSAPDADTTTREICVIGPYCAKYPYPTLIWTPIGTVPVPYSYGYVEATAICPFLDVSGAMDSDGRLGCKVSYDTRTLLPAFTLA